MTPDREADFRDWWPHEEGSVSRHTRPTRAAGGAASRREKTERAGVRYGCSNTPRCSKCVLHARIRRGSDAGRAGRGCLGRGTCAAHSASSFTEGATMDAIEFLSRDHREIEKLFDELENADDGDRAVRQIANELRSKIE